jgi:hypothetical protein
VMDTMWRIKKWNKYMKNTYEKCTLTFVSKQPYTHIIILFVKNVSLLQTTPADGNTSQHRKFVHIIPFSLSLTHKFTNYAVTFGTMWLHQIFTHWIAFSLDFPVTW